MRHTIYLVGARAAGKTTFGGALARQLGCNYVDTDIHLRETTGETVADIVAREGWDGFRKRESAVLRAVTAPGTVIATGGGMVLAEENRRFMRENGYAIITANYRCRLGEIDIIAKKDGFLVFTEVKTRSPGAIAPGREAVGSAKQERIIETASLFMQKNNYDLQPRFDVAEVTLGKENEPISCEYIENAFDSSF